MFAVAAVLMVTGCSAPDTTAPAPAASVAPSASTAAPATTAASAFCLDLTAFQVGVVVFRGDLVDAVRGKPLDIEDLRQRAANIAYTGQQMQASAPPDISTQFRAVLDAIATAASRLKPGAQVRDVVEPVFNDQINPAFDAVNNYECPTE